jgi:hypothetical protein
MQLKERARYVRLFADMGALTIMKMSWCVLTQPSDVI